MWRRIFLGLPALHLATQLAMAAEPVLLSDPAKVMDANNALVFVHGVLGSPTTSFGNWPQIIAMDQMDLPDKDKMSDFAVYAVDYQADFQSRMKLDNVASGVADELAGSQIFKRHRHVWFVAHSMGGLVLKRTLVLWREQEKSILVSRVMGVGLLGTPSAGAPLAKLAQTYGVDGLATTFGWDGALVKDLTTDGGSYLDALETDWLAFRSARDNAANRRFTPIIWCGFETKPELGPWIRAMSFVLRGHAEQDIDEIVPKLFTSTACDKVGGFPVKHTDLIKPKDSTDPMHGWLRSFITISITRGLKEQRNSLGTAPPALDAKGDVAFNMADRVGFLNTDVEDANLDQATGLPKEPEVIAFAPDQSEERAKKLVLQGGPFYGSTKLILWQEAAKTNNCIKVSNTPNRLKITLQVTDEVVQCPQGGNVCRSQSCR